MSNIATLRVQRVSQYDGVGPEGYCVRLTPGVLRSIIRELEDFRREMTAALEPTFLAHVDGFQVVTDGGRIMLVGRFNENRLPQ